MNPTLTEAIAELHREIYAVWGEVADTKVRIERLEGLR